MGKMLMYLVAEEFESRLRQNQQKRAQQAEDACCAFSLSANSFRWRFKFWMSLSAQLGKHSERQSYFHQTFPAICRTKTALKLDSIGLEVGFNRP